MIAALYARYSSDNQREESIVAQLRASREYCKQKGYTIIKEYADEACTGTNDNRPNYRQMFKDAKAGLFEIVIFHKIDRNARNEYDYYTRKNELQKYSVNIEYAAQNFDSSPEGRLMENTLVGLSAYYSRNLAKEIHKGQRENVLQGLTTGGKPPLGYKVINKKFVIDDYEAGAIRYIFESYAADKPYQEIINYLNDNGYRTRRGNTFGATSIHDMLHNRRYIGTCILGKNRKRADGKRNNHGADPSDIIIVENACPAIIEKELFEKVAMRMTSNKQRPGSHKAKYTYLLSGLIVCGECGTAMQGCTTTKSNGQINQYYRCGQKANKGTHTCPNFNVSLPDLEALVLRKIDEIIFAPHALEKLVSKSLDCFNKMASENMTEYDTLQAKQKSLERRMNNLYDLVEEGTADDFDKDRLRSTKSELLTIRAKLTEFNNCPNQQLTFDQVATYIEKYREQIKNKSADNLRALIQSFIDKVVISRDTITLKFKFEFTWCAW